MFHNFEELLITSPMEKRQESKGRSRPTPDASEIKKVTFKLHQALKNEHPFFCNYSERKPWEVTMFARDSAVHIMRFFKVWLDLPQNVFFQAVSYLDIFLARMKVQEKFLPCLSVSCFNLAANQLSCQINTNQLVMLSQSKCSVKDVERMTSIITQKFTMWKTNNCCNSLDLLKIYMDIFKYVALQFRVEGLLNRMLQWQQLSTRLEVLICDSTCTCFKPSVIALAFVHFEMERFLSREVPKKSNYYSVEMFYILAVMIELQSLCNINSDDYQSCFEAVAKVLKKYDGMKKTKNCQKLTWRFSTSTHELAKHTHYYPFFNTISEE